MPPFDAQKYSPLQNLNRFAERKMAVGREPMELRVEVSIAARFIHGQDSLNFVEGASVIAAEHQHFGEHREELRHRDLPHDPD